MTGLDASQVAIAGNGALYRAPLATAKPATSIVALDAAYIGLGYFSSDGAPMSFEDSVTNTFAWQNAALVRSSRTQTLTKLAFKPIQTRGSVIETFHTGSLVTEPTTGNFEVDIVPATQQRYTWVFDAVDGDHHYRYWIPNGEITERGDVMHQNGEPIGFPMTLTFYPDDTNKIATLLTDDPAVGIDIFGS